MWIFALFDLPSDSPSRRRSASRFRKDLLAIGFHRFQLSCYARYCFSSSQAHTIQSRVERFLPQHGEVIIFLSTDQQMSRTRIFSGRALVTPPYPPGRFLIL
ncbi:MULTISPECIES: CRISPR-associated endonuclease Cas2 [unclassified Thioalkalivibrio]|uniref:CRISPR-associated endonuclease Cas2 n=1 Tax=unclassified Thioalkalivibrio TaxID=2621013 RepID=UPI0009DB3357